MGKVQRQQHWYGSHSQARDAVRWSGQITGPPGHRNEGLSRKENLPIGDSPTNTHVPLGMVPGNGRPLRWERLVATPHNCARQGPPKELVNWPPSSRRNASPKRYHTLRPAHPSAPIFLGLAPALWVLPPSGPSPSGPPSEDHHDTHHCGQTGLAKNGLARNGLSFSTAAENKQEKC